MRRKSVAHHQIGEGTRAGVANAPVMRPRITVVAVGKVRDSHWKDAISEYSKRLGGYTSAFAVVEVADEPTPDGASEADETRGREREGERLLARIPERDVVVVCDSRGEQLDSVGLSRRLARTCVDGSGTGFTFVIGGSLGLADSVRERADWMLSFGSLTFPHALLRVMLLEQLFRAFKIDRGEAYHK